ncbi:T9SS C-terminal target domain-containing protein [Flavobacterium sp. WC2421]|uniref:T9SS C-terminal target domain-containing protein n=1 Tax=Flavobacterium sp. WC2421 TaxID=3234138 RepID=UPI0034668156
MKTVLLFFFLFITATYAQISGCTDPLSINYNSLATINDGSCRYRSTKIKPVYSASLPKNLNESSGLTQSNSLLWTINDDTDTALYALDTSGNIKQKVVLKNVSNKDWEEISQDSSYFYIGDFGNNVSGNRKDLHILKVEKKSLKSLNQKIDTISFSYSDQTDFTPLQPNTTNFDCEAFIVTNDSIYLFTKKWNKQNTSVYSLPKTPGNYIAQYKETFKIKGLVTGATYLPSQNSIALCGYSKTLHPFIYLLYNYTKTSFFNGNKRKIKLQLPFHQVEGIATADGLHYYLTNENFTRKPFVNSPQKLHQFDLSAYLSLYLIK